MNLSYSTLKHILENHPGIVLFEEVSEVFCPPAIFLLEVQQIDFIIALTNRSLSLVDKNMDRIFAELAQKMPGCERDSPQSLLPGHAPAKLAFGSLVVHEAIGTVTKIVFYSMNAEVKGPPIIGENWPVEQQFDQEAVNLTRRMTVRLYPSVSVARAVKANGSYGKTKDMDLDKVRELMRQE